MSNAIYFLKTVLPDADETVREYLNMIKSEINNSERIIADLLDFSRTKTPQLKSVTVNELVSQSFGKCSVIEKVTVEINIPDTLPLLRVDPFQMVQVFQNLITNACQAMPGGGTLSISARTAHGENDLCSELSAMNPEPDAVFVVISVADTGTGISPENMEKLFHPLFTTKAKGIGLGLVVCRNLSEANGGKIKAESELGRGTTFTVILPAAEGG